MPLPRSVKVTEVGMRDGFQMESRVLPTETKIAIGRALIAAGVRRLEATSFVSPRVLPQLADAAEVVGALKGQGASIAALVPNPRGALRAADAGVDQMVIFVSTSEAHNQANVNAPIARSLDGLRGVAEVANAHEIALHGAVATSFGCPLQGDVDPAEVLRVVERFADFGITDVVFGDTTGMATPPIIERLVRAVRDELPQMSISLHFHNTRGLGLVNVMAGLQLGITRFESSFGGLGGCPFAIGATGNICTEDLVNMLNELEIDTGIDLEAICAVARDVQALFGRELPGQVMKAGPRLKPANCA